MNHFLQLRGFRDLSNLNSAHDGYVEVYLDLGLVGVCLIVLILLSGYQRASRAFQHNPEFGSLMLVCIATATFYSVTEVGFRILAPSWIFLLLGVVGSSGAVFGLLGDQAPRSVAPEGGSARRMPAHGNLPREKKAVYTTRRSMTRFEVSRANNLR